MNALHFNKILEFLKTQEFEIHLDGAIWENNFEAEIENHTYVIIFYLETYITLSGASYYKLHGGICIYDGDIRYPVELSHEQENEIEKIIKRDVLDCKWQYILVGS